MSQPLLAVISGVIILAGAAGAFILPPGVSLAGLLLYAFATHLQVIGWWGIGVFSVLTALCFIVDILGPILGARGYHASKWGTIGAFVGMLAGMSFAGPLGILFGPFLGAFIGEMLSHANHERALRAAWGAFLGFMAGTAFKFLVGFSMFIYFIVALIRAR